MEGMAEHVMNKACRALWICRSTFDKTRGLKPRVVRWIYSVVIRPVSTYGTTVWCPRVKYNVNRTDLSKLYRD
jgi:hypothetical protein